MTNDRNFAGHVIAEWLDPIGVLFFSFVLLFLLGIGSLWYLAFQNVKEGEAFQKVCVDAGGVPVSTHFYVKGSQDGRLCINPSAIIQLKDEVK